MPHDRAFLNFDRVCRQAGPGTGEQQAQYRLLRKLPENTSASDRPGAYRCIVASSSRPDYTCARAHKPRASTGLAAVQPHLQICSTWVLLPVA